MRKLVLAALAVIALAGVPAVTSAHRAGQAEGGSGGHVHLWCAPAPAGKATGR